MGKYKFECNGTLFGDALVLLPTVTIYKQWDEIGINFVWLVFGFSIRRLTCFKYTFLKGDYTGKNEVVITKIKNEEAEKNE